MIFKPLLKSALGEEPCDLLFKNARFANLCTMEYETGDIAVKDGVIVGIGAGYEAKETVDCTGRQLLPGFIAGMLCAVVATLLDKAPAKEITDIYDKATMLLKED